MKIKFRDSKLGSKRNEVLDTITNVIESYRDQGYTLTLRQLYYQLVARDMIENSDKSYKRIGYILTEARYGGLVDWDAIEDRVRRPQLPYWVKDIPDAMRDTIRQFRLNRQKYQDTYLEVWVEKDALSSVLSRVTHEYHIPLMVNRGYSSASAMYQAYERFSDALSSSRHKNATIIYLGDHDPSGLDMVRDIEDRMQEMLSHRGLDLFLTVDAIALTMAQIREYNPPPNPAKLSDSRAQEYIANHGSKSWELDALPPEVLNGLLSDSILSYIDMEKFGDAMAEEQKMKNELILFNERFEDDEQV